MDEKVRFLKSCQGQLQGECPSGLKDDKDAKLGASGCKDGRNQGFKHSTCTLLRPKLVTSSCQQPGQNTRKEHELRLSRQQSKDHSRNMGIPEHKVIKLNGTVFLLVPSDQGSDTETPQPI